MKTIKNPAFLALFFILFSLTACSVLTDDNPLPIGTPPASGDWKVSYFFDKSDETTNYSGYTFEFLSNGQLTATQGSQSWTGTWTTGLDDSKNKFIIDFPG